MGTVISIYYTYLVGITLELVSGSKSNEGRGCHGTQDHEGSRDIYVTGIPYVDNCVKERAYKQAESACGNSPFLYRYHTEQFFSNSQIKAFLHLAYFAQALELHHDSVPRSLVSYISQPLCTNFVRYYIYMPTLTRLTSP